MAIVIDDMGPSQYTKRMIELPRPLTLSFLPYTKNLSALTDAAHARGHEVMLHMPMEPFAKKPREAFMITGGMDDEQITANLEKALSGLTHIAGVNNHMGSKVTSNRTQMDAVMAVLTAHKLFFLDSLTSGRSVAAQAAQDAGLPNLTRDVFLDDQHDVRTPYERLIQTAARAQKHGYAVAIGHPVGPTYGDLARFLESPASKDVEIVPVGTLLKKKHCMQAQAAAYEGKGASSEWADKVFLAAIERDARDVDLIIGAVAHSLGAQARH